MATIDGEKLNDIYPDEDLLVNYIVAGNYSTNSQLSKIIEQNKDVHFRKSQTKLKIII